MEDGALHFQLLPELGGVGQVAVVTQGHGALVVLHHDGLGVGPDPAAGGGVADVARGHPRPLGQGGQHLGGEYLADQAHVPVPMKDAVHIQGHAAALLAPVLEGIQGGEGGVDHIGTAGTVIDAENAAFFPEFFHSVPSF